MSSQTPTDGPAPQNVQPQPSDVPPAEAKRPLWKRKRVIIPAGVVALLIVIGALSGGEEPGVDAPTAQATTSEREPTEEQAPAEKSAAEIAADEEAERQAEEERAAQEEAERVAEEERKAEEARQAEEERVAAEAAAAEEAARIGTVSQQNAYRSAKNYVDLMPFSRAGLIGQLTSEYGDGFPAADAEFAVSRLEAEGGVDWNAEAAEAAKNYLELMGFSRSGLIEQLTSEFGDQFTREQAEYGVDQTGL